MWDRIPGGGMGLQYQVIYRTFWCLGDRGGGGGGGGWKERNVRYARNYFLSPLLQRKMVEGPEVGDAPFEDILEVFNIM